MPRKIKTGNLVNWRALKLLWFLLPVILIGGLAGCGDNAFYENFKSIDHEAWVMTEVKEFPVHINDIDATYRLIITVRNTTDYKYSNLYMFLSTIQPGQTVVRDTIECLLADRYGHWLGRGVGKIRENRFLIKDQLSFPDTGNYVFRIEQAMRDEILEGISDIGLRIEKTIIVQP